MKSRLSLTLSLAVSAALTTLPVLAQGSFRNPFGGSDTGAEQDAQTVTTDAGSFARPYDTWAAPFMNALYRDGEWGAVLNLSEFGLAAMEQGRYAIAAKALDQAIMRVESIYAGDENASKARSTFNAEKVKDFKGEPYERSMLYFYRGLLYVKEGDLQNARAAFLAADRHDTLSAAEDTAFAGDFGMMKYLAGWASYCDGDALRGEQLVSEAKAADNSIAALPSPPRNHLVLIDTGPAPVKWGDGQYRQILKLQAGTGSDDGLTLHSGERTLDAFATLGNVTYQATTRGGREVDGILAGKAQFKDTAGTVGNVALNAGAQLAAVGAMTGNRDMSGAGLVGLLIGVVAKAAEASANPAADVRAWTSLPAQVDIVADDDVSLDAATFTWSRQASGKPLALSASSGKCALGWARTRPALSADQGGTAVVASEQPDERNRGDRNKAFRAMLASDFSPQAVQSR